MFLKYSLVVILIVVTPFFAFGDARQISDSQQLLKVQAPSKKPIVLRDGRVRVSSVESFDVQKDDDITECSFIARNNLSMLLKAMRIPQDSIARGDADTLIKQGQETDVLTPIGEKNSLIGLLESRNQVYGETVFDVYRHAPSRPPEIQSHRAVVFFGEDRRWYILDPIDGQETRDPQLFSRYIERDTDDATWFVQFPGYSLGDLMSYDVFLKVMPLLSPELSRYYQGQQYVQVPWKLRRIVF